MLFITHSIGNFFASSALAATPAGWQMGFAITIGVIVAVILLLGMFVGARYIPHDRVGIVEKLWSGSGSVPEGRVLALNGEAGYQGDVLRGGLHFGYWRWQYRIHKVPLVTVPQGRIGYVYARDGESLLPSQTLGRVVVSNNFQDARAFLVGGGGSPESEPVLGQRGRQRAFLREGVYAVNLSMFIIFTEDTVYRLELPSSREWKTLAGWQDELNQMNGFHPVVIGGPIETADPLI